MKRSSKTRAFPQCWRSWKQHAMVLLALWFCSAVTGRADTQVTLVRTPSGGIQPQAAVDAKGTFHLVYFSGDAGAGDLFYVRREPGKERFSEPIQVNSLPGSAVATGTVRGAQLAIGKGGRVHVAWNGSARAQGAGGAPMLYARLNDAGTAFESQRNLIQDTVDLDGGGTVAADGSGNVYVAWHALQTGSQEDEEHCHVWVARSTDGGKSFSKEILAWKKSTGSCGCCGMCGLADSKGSVYMLYRSAKGGNRDIYLLWSTKSGGQSFRGAIVHRWKVSTCPMSTMALAEGLDDVVAAWETDGQIYFARIKSGSTDIGVPQGAPGFGKTRKHPALAVNDQREMILVWTEGTGWRRGGDLVWQVFDKSGKPTQEKGRRASGIPVWGLPTVVAKDGGFIIVH